MRYKYHPIIQKATVKFYYNIDFFITKVLVCIFLDYLENRNIKKNIKISYHHTIKV